MGDVHKEFTVFKTLPKIWLKQGCARSQTVPVHLAIALQRRPSLLGFFPLAVPDNNDKENEIIFERYLRGYSDKPPAFLYRLQIVFSNKEMNLQWTYLKAYPIVRKFLL